MAGGFLHKLLGRASPLPPEVRAAREELERLRRERPAWAGPVGLLHEALPALYEEPVSESPPTISPEDAAAKLAGGLPLLRGTPFEPDEAALGRRWQRVCAAAAGQPGG